MKRQFAVYPGNFFRFSVTGKHLPFLIYPNHALFQDFKQQFKLAFQAAASVEHLVKAVGIGRHRVLIRLKPGCFQQFVQPKTQSRLGHGGGGQHPLANIQHFFDAGRGVTLLMGCYHKIIVFRPDPQRRPRIVHLKHQLVDPQLVQAADCLPGHLIAQIDKQYPCPRRKALQLANHFP